MDIKYIEKLAKLIQDNSLTELSISEGETKIVLKKEDKGQNPQPVVQTQAKAVAPVAQEEKPVKKAKGKAITSPMVGTFYKAPAVGAPSFVEVGGLVAQGEVVCIIEAMKLMNEIESDFSGKVVEICVEDGQPVEYGQVLMYIE